MHKAVRDYFEREREKENRGAIVEKLDRTGGHVINAAAATAGGQSTGGGNDRKDRKKARGKSKAARKAETPPTAAAPRLAQGTLPNFTNAAASPPLPNHDLSKVPCKFFNKGRCTNTNCRFMHSRRDSSNGRSPSAGASRGGGRSQSNTEKNKTQYCIGFYKGRCPNPCKDGRLHEIPTGTELEKLNNIINGVKPMCRQGNQCTYKNCKFRHARSNSAAAARVPHGSRQTPRGTWVSKGGSRYHKGGSRTSERGTRYSRNGSRTSVGGRRRSRGGRTYSKNGTRQASRSSTPRGTKLTRGGRPSTPRTGN